MSLSSTFILSKINASAIDSVSPFSNCFLDTNGLNMSAKLNVVSNLIAFEDRMIESKSLDLDTSA
jgi:hypothetical protein